MGKEWVFYPGNGGGLLCLGCMAVQRYIPPTESQVLWNLAWGLTIEDEMAVLFLFSPRASCCGTIAAKYCGRLGRVSGVEKFCDAEEPEGDIVGRGLKNGCRVLPLSDVLSEIMEVSL